MDPVKPVVVKLEEMELRLTLFRPQQVLVKVLIVLNIPVVAAVVLTKPLNLEEMVDLAAEAEAEIDKTHLR